MDSIRRKAEEIMKRGDAVIEQHKHRNAIIRRTAALSLGTAAVLMIGISAQLLKAPKKLTPASSGIITETSEATSADAVTTTLPLRTSTTTLPATTTSTSDVMTTSSVSQTTVIVRTTEVNTTTVMRSTAVTSEAVVSTTQSTIESAQITTSATTDNSSSGEILSTENEYEKLLDESFETLELLNSTPYHIDCYYANEKEIGEFLYETTVSPSAPAETIPAQTKAKVYEKKDVNTEYMLLILLENSENYRVYVNRDYLRKAFENSKKEG